MLIGIFKSNQPYTAFFFPFISAIAWASVFITTPVEIPEDFAPSRIYYDLSGMPKGLVFLLGVLSTSLGAFLVSRIFNRKEILESYTHITGMWYVLISAFFALHPNLLYLSLSNFILLLSFERLTSIYREKSAVKTYFEAGLILGLATLIWPCNVYLLPFLILGILYVRSYKPREVFFPVLGVAIPWIYLFSYLFLKERSNAYAISDFNPIPLWLNGISASSELVFLIFSLIILLLSLRSFGFSFGRSLKEQKTMMTLFLIWSFGVALSGLKLLQVNWLIFMGFLAISLSVSLVFYFDLKRRSILLHIIFYIWLFLWTISIGRVTFNI